MNKKIKKASVLLLSFFLVVILSACGSGDKNLKENEVKKNKEYLNVESVVVDKIYKESEDGMSEFIVVSRTEDGKDYEVPLEEDDWQVVEEGDMILLNLSEFIDSE